MVRLVAKSPLDGLVPVEAGAARLDEVAGAHIWAIAPLRGAEEALSEALKAAHGLALPAPRRVSTAGGLVLIWAGYRQYLLVGEAAADAGLGAHAALTDLGDGWVVLRLSGKAKEAVLARLTPLDLHPGVFRRGHTARTELAHMMAVVTRTARGIEIMVMRSFAETAVEALSEAMRSVAAQARIEG